MSLSGWCEVRGGATRAGSISKAYASDIRDLLDLATELALDVSNAKSLQMQMLAFGDSRPWP